jgi:protein gp37
MCCGEFERGIDWIIVGGESGHGARPMHQGWARSLRDQCTEGGVPFLFKQWGEWAPGNEGAGGDLFARDRTKCASGFFTYNNDWIGNGPNPFRQTMDRIGKKAAGRHLDGRTHDEFPT